jgi:hypothetical protein
MTALTVGSRIVANVALSRVSLVPILGGFELVFGVHGHTTADEANYWLMANSAQVQVGNEQGDLWRLGAARSDSVIRIRTGKSAMTVSSELRMPLTTQQLAAIEDLRAGGDLRFQLALLGEGGPEVRPGEVHAVHDTLWLGLGRSDWIVQLRTARAMDILLLEVAMPLLEPSEANRSISDALKRAQKLLAEGHYSECVINCRKAIEGLATMQGRLRNWSPDALRRLANGREAMTKEEREVALEASLFHFASLAAHDASTEFRRRDAKLAVTLVASLVAHHLSS